MALGVDYNDSLESDSYMTVYVVDENFAKSYTSDRGSPLTRPDTITIMNHTIVL